MQGDEHSHSDGGVNARDKDPVGFPHHGPATILLTAEARRPSRRPSNARQAPAAPRRRECTGTTGSIAPRTNIAGISARSAFTSNRTRQRRPRGPTRHGPQAQYGRRRQRDARTGHDGRRCRAGSCRSKRRSRKRTPQAANSARAGSACRSGRDRRRAVGDPRFGARWPENLPKAEEMEQSEPAPVGSVYAEPREARPRKRRRSCRRTPLGGETALRYTSIAGIVLIPLVLLAGWVAKLPASRTALRCRSRCARC